MERSNGHSSVTEQTMLATTAEGAVLSVHEIHSELDEVRAELAGAHAERSRRLIEGSTSAENIRHSSGEVADYIQGLATDLYIRLTEQEGVDHDEAVVQIDAFIAEQTHLLLSDMTDMRTQNVTDHNRFMPKRVTKLYDKALEVWRSWEVPTGDGALVSRLRETGTWQHLEKKADGNGRGAKLGRFALLAVKSSINGIENLKYSGARKRLAAMAGLGMISGAAAGALLGVVGAGAAGAVAGSMAARATVRSATSTKLNRDANIDTIALHDQVRMQGRIDQITTEDYSVQDILGYVEGETETMLQQNNLRLLSGMAIGIVGGVLGNGVARGAGWLAGHYIDAQFNTVAYADVVPKHVVSDTSAPNYVINGSSTQNLNHVVNGTEQPYGVINGNANAAVVPSHVINQAIIPNHVIDGTHTAGGAIVPDHVIQGAHTKGGSILPNHVIDGSLSTPNHVIDGGSPAAENEVSHDTFYVESGHGFIREIQDYSKENGYGKLSSSEAYQMYKLLLHEHGKNGLIDVKGIKHDTYVEDGDVRISAAGKAQWRTGVEHDLTNLMRQHQRHDSLTLHSVQHTTEVNHTIDNSAHHQPNHVTGYDSVTENSTSSHNTTEFSSGAQHISNGEGYYHELGQMGVAPADQAEVLHTAASQLYDQGATYQMNDGLPGINMTPDHMMPQESLETLHQAAIETNVSDNLTVTHDGVVFDEALDSASTTTTDNGEFLVTDFGKSYDVDAQSYYDALKGLDRSDWQTLLNEAAPKLQSVKYDGESLTYRTSSGWHFREVEKLPSSATKILADVANKHGWTLAA